MGHGLPAVWQAQGSPQVVAVLSILNRIKRLSNKPSGNASDRRSDEVFVHGLF
jgi:hypothetical protein